jgi:ABC-type branched-subunit amino acid transport system permease subunit
VSGRQSVWLTVAVPVVVLAVYWPLVRTRLGRVDVLLAELDRREAAQS